MLAEKIFLNKSKKISFVGYLIIIQLMVFGTFTFFQAQTWKTSEILWLHVIKVNPEEGMAYNNLAVEYLDAKKDDSAVDALKNALKYRETYPEFYRSYHNIGKAYSESGKKKMAIQYYDTAISIVPQFYDAVFGRGLTYTDMGEYDNAIADFTTILKTDNLLHAESYYSRAISYNKKNMKDSALADYTRAVGVKPDYAEAYTNRGNIYFTIGKLDEAISDYSVSLKFDPDNGLTLQNRSFAYFKRQNYHAALADAEKAISLKIPVNPAYINDVKSFIAKGLN
jgi:tetratricopeptide (TPR) repeat protein